MTDPLASITAGVKGLGSNLSDKLTSGLDAAKGSVKENLNTVGAEFADLGAKAKGLLPGQNAPTAPVATGPVATGPVAPAGTGGRRRRTRKSKKSSKKGKKRSSRKGKKRSTKKRVRFSRRK